MFRSFESRKAGSVTRQAFFVIGLLLALAAVGTVGLRITTGEPWLHSLYMAIITLTTVGSRDAAPNSVAELFVIVYLIFGLGIFTYSAFQLGQFVVNAQRRSIVQRERRRMENAISKLRNHFIVCGGGRMGQIICNYLQERGKPFVVIDVNEQVLLAVCEEEGWLYVLGDATDDDVLLRAGIERAQALTSVLPTDADNVYVVLSARLLASELQIIARASDEKAIEKMQRAGASRVVSPFSSGAEKMARFMISPSVEDFLEIADAHGNELELADVQILESSPYVGKRLMDTDIRAKGVMVIGIQCANGERLMPPPGTAVIQAGDSLFAFGSAEAVNEVIGETVGEE